MNLPILPPFAPMEARSVNTIPRGSGWQYEPKWDGFRCLVFKEGAEVFLQFKSGQPPARYFPEVVEFVRRWAIPTLVMDGELAVPVNSAFDFDQLLQRIHPAQSRVLELSSQFPATCIAFDLLVDHKARSQVKTPLKDRRRLLEEILSSARNPQLQLSPATRDWETAVGWFEKSGGDLDGIVAKALDLPYLTGERVMQKVKRIRSADCVVGGFRYGTDSKWAGSLLLGLYAEDGLLHHVGFCSGLKSSEKPGLTKKLESLRGAGFTGRAPGGPSRWSTKRSAQWVRLRPELVAEVTYDHFTGGRFRHGTRLVRWRPDKAPTLCRMDQLESGAVVRLPLMSKRRRSARDTIPRR